MILFYKNQNKTVYQLQLMNKIRAELNKERNGKYNVRNFLGNHEALA